MYDKGYVETNWVAYLDKHMLAEVCMKAIPDKLKEKIIRTNARGNVSKENYFGFSLEPSKAHEWYAIFDVKDTTRYHYRYMKIVVETDTTDDWQVLVSYCFSNNKNNFDNRDSQHCVKFQFPDLPEVGKFIPWFIEKNRSCQLHLIRD
jgi:hypothetical protein